MWPKVGFNIKIKVKALLSPLYNPLLFGVFKGTTFGVQIKNVKKIVFLSVAFGTWGSYEGFDRIPNSVPLWAV